MRFGWLFPLRRHKASPASSAVSPSTHKESSEPARPKHAHASGTPLLSRTQKNGQRRQGQRAIPCPSQARARQRNALAFPHAKKRPAPPRAARNPLPVPSTRTPAERPRFPAHKKRPTPPRAARNPLPVPSMRTPAERPCFPARKKRPAVPRTACNRPSAPNTCPAAKRTGFPARKKRPAAPRTARKPPPTSSIQARQGPFPGQAAPFPRAFQTHGRSSVPPAFPQRKL